MGVRKYFLAAALLALAAFAYLLLSPAKGVPAPVGEIGIDYASIFLDPVGNGYSFAAPGMDQYVKFRSDWQNGTYVMTHDKACTIPFNGSLVNVVRITRLAGNSYNISCLFGPWYPKADYGVRRGGAFSSYFEAFSGWVRECTPKAAELFDVGFPENKTIGACVGAKAEMVGFGSRDPSEVTDYYYAFFACNELSPQDPFYAYDISGKPRVCSSFLEGFGQKSRVVGIGMLVDAQRKEVYFPISVSGNISYG